MTDARPKPGGQARILLPSAVIVVLAGLWGALARLGYHVPAAATSSADHGVLMSLGFIGTLIAVERATALGRWWSWIAPAASVAGSVWLVLGGAASAGRALLVVAGVVLFVTYVALDRIQRSTHNTLMAVAALGWVVTTAFMVAGRDVARLVPWLAVFLVITITAERLELSRTLGITRTARKLLVGAVLIFLVGATISIWTSQSGVRVGGIGLLAMTLWLVTFDIARRTVRQHGITRFMAAGLLAGYAWLGVGGLLWLVFGYHVDDHVYDAQLHAVFLGFVLSMIFAHAPVIVPTVVRRPLPYRSAFYGPLALLHVSLVLRIVGGDAAGSQAAWQIGGVLNEVALLGFVGVTASTLFLAGRRMPSVHVVARRLRSPAAAGVALGLVVTAVAVVFANSGSSSNADPMSHHDAATGTNTVSGVTAPAGATTTVDISLVEMRIEPSTVIVKSGQKLILHVTNKGHMRHDLKLSSGVRTTLLNPGQSVDLDAGVVTKALSGWCTVPGHRAAGMTMNIELASSASKNFTGNAMAGMGNPNSEPSANDAISKDLAAQPSSGWKPYDAMLPPVRGSVHDVTWHVKDVVTTVAPGVTQTLWTFDGTAPGPILHGRVGDTFNVTLVNDTDMAHNLDFHAESGPPSSVMVEVPPGSSHTYTFVADRAGAWLYHCGTEPMLLHMANGMYGALIVDPPDLAPVAKQYVLVGSEFFFGPQGGIGDYAKMAKDLPDTVVFNGYPFAYTFAPLKAEVGDRVRVWVVDAGPSRSLAFHVVGAPFDTLFLDGSYHVKPSDAGGAQTLPVDPGDGGFVEFSFTQPGEYPFLTHVMADAVLGASGTFSVSG